MKKGGNKRGQLTIFIIIAIVIIVLAIIIYMMYPKIKTWFSDEINPNAYILNCIEEDIEIAVQTLSTQGGSIDPGHYIWYNGEKIEYLCYTEEYYKTCVMQQPMLKNHIESEIKEQIKDRAEKCFNSMEEEYRAKGYNVNLKRGETDIELSPKKIVTTFNHDLTLIKDTTIKYEKFIAVVDNNLYELVSITNSILNWEASYGDAETTTYMNYYRDLKVEKKKQSDGSTIYILTDRNTGDKFQFASRSVAWPPGYGKKGVLGY